MKGQNIDLLWRPDFISTRSSGLLLASDHVYPAGGTSGADHVTVVLYGEIGRDAFRTLHQLLMLYAQQNKISYIIRHYTKVRHGKPANVRFLSFFILEKNCEGFEKLKILEGHFHFLEYNATLFYMNYN